MIAMRHKNFADWNIGYSRVITSGTNIQKYDEFEIDKVRFRKENQIPKGSRVLITGGRLRKRKGVLWFWD